MNYVDDDYVMGDLIKIATRARGKTISIYWYPQKSNIVPAFNLRIRKSISSSRIWLIKHMKNHGVQEGMIAEMRTDIYMAKNRQVFVNAYVKDIRGKEHLQNVTY